MSPALSLLLGPQAAGILDAAVGEYGANLSGLQIADVHVAPTGGVRVRYTGEVRRADGSRRQEILVAATGDHIPPGAAVLAGEFEGKAVEVGVWRWPQDPALPGLVAATHPLRLAELLAGAGQSVVAAPRVTVRGYRPGQRAVLEVSDGRSRWFVKVVPPAAVEGLQLRHALLGATLPVPQILAATAAGIVVLPEAPGTLLRQALSEGDHAAPNPLALQEMLDALPGELMDQPARRGPLQRFEQSVRVLRMTTRGLPDEPFSTVGEIADVLRSAPTSSNATVPVHGDFYDGQLLVDGGRISAVLDVDTAGPGERVDEWATMLGHLSVFGLTNPGAADYCAALLAHAERHVDPEEVRFRTAAVVLGLATGPFRAQREDWPQRTAARLDVAGQWLSSMRDRSSPAPATLISARHS